MHGLRAFVLMILVGLLLVSGPSEAFASASPPEPAPVPLPGLVVDGPAEIDGLTVVVACTGDDVLETSVDCEVRGTFVVRALEDVRLGLTTPDEAVIWVEGRPLVPGEVVARGAGVSVALSFHRHLATSTRDTEGPWLLMLLRARHMVLGEPSSLQHVGDDASGLLVAGSRLQLIESAQVDDTQAGAVVVDSEGAHLSLSLAGRAATTSLLRNGGPVLALGTRFDLFREDDGRFLLGVGYELGLDDYVTVSLLVETDFDSLMECVLLEAGTPEVLIVLPGLVGGVGVVARQLGSRDADAGVRLRAGVQYVAVGLTADFDYWPVLGDWTASMAVRISI